MTEPASIVDQFLALLEGARPATGGVALTEIAAETAPVLPLLSELPAETRARGDYESFQFRECFTVLTLLGRRLALLDLTPTAALQVVDLALDAVAPEDGRRVSEFDQRAVAALLEGFVMGREERVAQVAETRASKPLKPLRVDEAAFALILTGVHDAEVLSECVDALGRAMLDADVEAAIVDLSQLGEPNRDRAAAVFTADEVARMLGGACFFSGVDSRWRAAADDARISLHLLNLVPSFPAALSEARALASRNEAERSPRWRGILERLRR